MLPESYGCAIFDDPYEHLAGFSATSESARAARISGTESLDSSCLWLTNLSFNIANNSGFSGHSRFRRDDYFGGTLKQLTDIVGLREDGVLGGYPQIADYIRSHKPGELISTGDMIAMRSLFLSGVFSRVSRISNALFGIETLDANGFNTIFRRVAFQYDPIMPNNLATAIDDARVYSILTEKSGVPRGDNTMSFRVQLPPVDHAINMLQLPMPAGEWKHYVRKRDILNVLADIEQPYLAKVVLSDILPEFNRLLNFGSGGQNNRRAWVSSIELDYLKHMANVDIKELYVSEYALQYDWVTEARDILINARDKLSLSFSGGMVAKAVWSAMSKKHAPGRGNYVNPASPFIHALDRRECLVAAMSLSAQGYSIGNYGMGAINVNVESKEEMIALAKDSLNLGLMPSAVFESIDLDHDQPPAGIMNQLVASGEISKIVDIDERVTTVLEGGNNA